MRIRLGLSCAALLSMSMAFTACGGDDDASIGDGDGDGVGGEKSIDTQVDDLRDEIKRLEALIKDGDGNQADLEKELEEAKERLKELETCNSGGSCEGLNDTKETLSALSDAYCEWLYGCCEDEEVRASAAPHFSDVDDCKDTYGDMIARGNAGFEFYLEGSAYGFGSEIANMLETASMRADALQKGRIKVDKDNLAACVDYINAQQCGSDKAEVAPACSPGMPTACEDIYIGLQMEGEACDNYYYGGECEEGLICGYGAGYAEGICIPEAEEEDRCIEDSQCYRQDQSLYCDAGSGECKERPGKGEKCEFLDSQFQSSGYNLIVPCQSGLECSPSTSTCVEPCAEDSYCYVNGNDCDEGLKCQVTPYDGALGSYGHCGSPGEKGEERNYAAECESGSIYYDANLGENACTGIGGEACDLASECASGIL